MKSIKTALLGVSFIAAAATMAHSQTRLYFTGSTAFRGAAVDAIHNQFDSGSLTYGYTGTTETKQDAAVYNGTIGGNPYIIKTFWTGSEAGIQAVSDDGVGIALPYPADTPDKGGVETALTSGGLQNIDDPTTTTIAHPDNEVPQVDMADTYQATSLFRPGNTVVYVDASSHTFPSLTSTVVGIVPFDFVASKGSTITNVTTDVMKNLFSTGILPRALFTGLNSDETVPVFATGRNPDSGTRLTALTDTGYGANKVVTQYEPVQASGAQVAAVNETIASIYQWPLDTVNSVAIAAHNSGYNSGGKLAGALGSVTTGMILYTSSNTVASTGGDIISYLSTSDAGTAVGGGATILAYNGVLLSNTTLYEGEYTFWGFEHLNYLSSFTSNAGFAVVQSIASNIATVTGTASGNYVSSMNVTRAGSSNKDGGTILPNYSNY